MKNYQVTIGYKAVIQIDVKAETPKEAEQIAMEKMDAMCKKMESVRGLTVADNNYAPNGTVDITESWDMVQS